MTKEIQALFLANPVFTKKASRKLNKKAKLINNLKINKMKQITHLKTICVVVFFTTINMTGQNNVKIIENLYAAFAVGDIPKVLAGLDEKVVWNEAEGNKYADGNPYIGPQAVLNGVFARIGAEYEYFKLVNIQLHEMENNQVLATLRYQAKLKNNGATYDAQVAHLWTLKAGKVIAFQQYLDTKKVAEAIAK